MKNVRVDGMCAAGVLLALALVSPLAAETMVTLGASASPSAGDAGANTITLTGHGFPSGTIPPANVTVTLNPATVGAGPSGTTTATAVTVVTGTEERVSFKIPTSIVVTAATAYQVSISGTTSTGTAFASSNSSALTVNAPVTVTTASPLPSGSVGTSYSDTLAASGGSGTYTWSVASGALPAGLTLAASGLLSGTPTTAGASHFVAKATDSLGGHGTKSLALTIANTLTITTASPLPTGTVGVNYTTTLTATGGSGYSWSVSSGSLPAGLTLSAGTGVISGQPTTAGTSSFTIHVTDSAHAAASKAFTMTVNAALTITTSSPLPTGTVGVNYLQTLTATGGSGVYTWLVSGGALPAGLTLGAATGAISGQPTTAGTPGFTIQVTDSNSATASKAFTVTIDPALVITTASPLPTGTVGVNYAQTLSASGGTGSYTWSVIAGALPAGLTLAASTGVISGQPTTAGTPGFTIQVTDTNSVTATKAFTVTIDPALTITTTSPLPAGQVGATYSDTLTAAGGSGSYTWSISAGSLPGGLTLTASTGVIAGTPTTPATANFTIQVTDTAAATASLPVALTINPAAAITSVTPGTGYQGFSMQVTITGSNTHFAQGTTVASFGPGIAVGGAAAGQPGPVTVNSSTSATAEIAVSASAAIGSQTVTVTTGAEAASLANGFTIDGAIPSITVTTSATTPLSPGISGFNDPYLLHGVEYWDPKYLPLVEALKPGWIRFPGGTTSMAFDWETAHMNTSWMAELQPLMSAGLYNALVESQDLTQAKGGACIYQGGCVGDYTTFVKTVGANSSIVVNGYTDNNPNSAGNLVSTAATAGLDVLTWEIDNEAYCCHLIYANSTAYLNAAYNPTYQDIVNTNPSANTSPSYMGEYSGLLTSYTAWDNPFKTFSPQFWTGAVFHIYPITNDSISETDEEQTLNGVLAYGTTDYYTDYIQPLIGANTPVFFTEIDSDGYGNLPFEAYIYNAIFLVEWISRMSTIPQVKAVGVTDLFLGNAYNQGVIRAVNDYQTYLINQVKANPNYSTNTATNPNTQFQFYNSANALGLTIGNTAINGSSATWATTVNGGPTVPIICPSVPAPTCNGNPIPAVYAQGYQGTGGENYLLVTNKSGSSVSMGVVVNGNLLEGTVNLTYVTSATYSGMNTATNQNALQIQSGSSSNPVTIGPYSITLIQW